MNPSPSQRKTLLIAPDSFKGSLSAVKICAIIENWAAQQSYPLKIISRPMSDGGEGFVDAFVYSGLAQPVSCVVEDPLGRLIHAQFAWQAHSKTALIEMAQASGLPLLLETERDPLRTSTFGTGQLIQAALNLGAQKIVLGLGGSATNDGGSGALQALGFGLLGADQQPISKGAQGLSALSHIEFSATADDLKKLQTVDWIVACDVTNPLLGEQGATAVFGPQKGVTSATHGQIENGLRHFAQVAESTFFCEAKNQPGAGAAGGMAFGLVSFLNAELVSGFDLLADVLGLHEVFQQHAIDLVITAEGRIDAQTRYGKLPMKIAELAQKNQVSCIGLCGLLEIEPQLLPMFKALHSIHEAMDKEATLERLLRETPQNLTTTLSRYLPSWLNL